MSTHSALQLNDPSEFARSLFEGLNDALLLFDPRTLKFVDANPAAQRLIEVSSQSLQGRSIPEFFVADREERVEELMRCCRTGEHLTSQDAYQLVRHNEDPIDVSITLSRLDLQPAAVGVILVRDLTDQRRLEANLRNTQSLLMATINNQSSNLEAATAELRSNEQRMQELLNDVDAIVWEANLPELRFTYVSRRAKKVFGFPVEQWLEEPSFWVNHLHPEDITETRTRYEEAARAGQDLEFDYRAITADNRVVWIRNTMHVVKDADQNPVKLRGVMKEVTRRIESEQKLQALERELKHVSRLSTLGAMVAGIAHEVNQPLAAISNFASAAHNELNSAGFPNDSPLVEWMDQIRDQAIRCGDIIRRMRDFTRKGGSQREFVDVHRVVSDSIVILQSNLRQHALKIDVDFSDVDLTVRGNATELQQVIVNLLSNAQESIAEAAPEDPRIRIHGIVEDDRLIVSVTDNGLGIRPRILPRLFDPFFTTRSDGLGIGLAISRTIIENHGGKLSVVPEHTPGACFRFELPVSIPTIDTRSTEANSDPNESP